MTCKHYALKFLFCFVFENIQEHAAKLNRFKFNKIQHPITHNEKIREIYSISVVVKMALQTAYGSQLELGRRSSR